MKLLIIFCFLWFAQVFSQPAGSQPAGFFPQAGATENVWVFFTDKENVEFDPFAFFHPKAIERRLRHGQDLFDEIDFPVRADYLQTIAGMVDSLDVVSRWFNAVSVYASPLQLETLERLDFVDRIEYMTLNLLPAAYAEEEPIISKFSTKDMELLLAHTAHLKGRWFHKNGFDGRGIRIAIFDAGFPGVDEHPAFKHILNENRIVATRDFVRNQQGVFHKNSHGASVMSVIGGLIDSVPMGLATGAEFLLARTETWTEFFSEEKNWLAAVEWADQHGADIINSSLGYTRHRYFPEDMDGNSSLVARAAAIAFQKGMLIVNAAGNEGGTESWKIIGTPADAPEVLSVGAVDFPSLLRADYSSRGPTADGRLSPSVSALGTVYAAGKSGFKRIQGTSFASPLLAGFAACLWQMHPDWTNQQVFDAIQQSATLFPYFDYSHGYGIPQADFFFRNKSLEIQPTFEFEITKDTLKVLSRLKTLNETGLDRQDRYLYYQVRDASDLILEYSVLLATETEILKLNLSDFEPGQKILVHLAGYTSAWTFLNQ
ncbi:MAG: S8 family serine peptidase [Bacteroidales bacterium]|nr:S8 family serine peptidase [Bacteroidales bacterium]